MKKRAAIFGISGQDGAYLADLLLKKNYSVYGFSRDAVNGSFENLKKLNILNCLNLSSVSLNDFKSVQQAIIDIEPDEIYNLAAQSSVGISYEKPIETMESILFGTVNLLEAIRIVNPKIRYYSSCSSDCFGDTGGSRANERTPFRPSSPYAVAKTAAFWQVKNCRETYGIFACTGILSNHESPLRSERFVTRKIVTTACRIANGSNETLSLENLEIERDWGWAPDYVEAAWRMLQSESSEDFIIATGVSHTLQQFLYLTFELLGLNWQDHTLIERHLARPTDIKISRLNPHKIETKLGWRSQVSFSELIGKLIKAEQLKYT